MSDNFNKERILKNSLLLYLRMLFTMWLNLYATRLTLANLGVENMGVYGIIGSIVSLFTVLTSGITSAVQRFITFELGLENGHPNKVFCSSLNIIFVLSVILLIMLEIGGTWMLDNKINIPEASRNASFWVFQLSVLTCIVNTISIPYNALIIAHEQMNAFAIISVVQVVLNFGAAYFISFFKDDRLLIYAIMLAIASIIVRLLYQVYCHRNFKEARYHWVIDWNIIKQIGAFTGVTTISGGLQIIASQGIVFIINITFGVAINAVYSIALQLKNAILSFSLNILKAISPQITKTYANGEMIIHEKLVYSGSKLEAFFIYIIMIPFLFRTEQIMRLWLGEVPDYAVVFSQCAVFISLTYAIFEPIRTAVRATNRIAKFMLVPDTIYLLVLPISYGIGKLTNNPYYFIISTVLFEILVCTIRIWYAAQVTIFRKRDLLFKVLYPCIMVACVDCILCYGLTYIFPDTIKGLIFMVLVNCFCLIGLIYMIGLTQAERNQIKLAYQAILTFQKRH